MTQPNKIFLENLPNPSAEFGIWKYPSGAIASGLINETIKEQEKAGKLVIVRRYKFAGEDTHV